MTNTIRLKITCFLLLFTVLLIKDILDLAWHLATRMKFGTCEQNWDFFSETKFSKTETLKDLAKVSKPRSFETEMSISGQHISKHSVIFINRNVIVNHSYSPLICPRGADPSREGWHISIDNEMLRNMRT